ncbi:hypothetical protein CAEBREN_19076 [Caenorhabditis brenneri]|uniref:Uncharacterized protein n=1 Tax=Caenorhabditis brenneri TaxID=135651 RepID=G0MJL9_CAEBE|nr:hypothetical protein CAEBREN_19076 [Caenorhabditis brenneri]
MAPVTSRVPKVEEPDFLDVKREPDSDSSDGHDNLENIDENLVKVEKIAEKLKKDYEEVKEINKKPEDSQLFRPLIDQFATNTEHALNKIWTLKEVMDRNVTMERTEKLESLHRLNMVRDQLRCATNNAYQQLQKSQSRLMNILVHNMSGLPGFDKEEKVKLIGDSTLATHIDNFQNKNRITTSPKQNVIMTWIGKSLKNPQFKGFLSKLQELKNFDPLVEKYSRNIKKMDTLKEELGQHLQKRRKRVAKNKRAHGGNGEVNKLRDDLRDTINCASQQLQKANTRQSNMRVHMMQGAKGLPREDALEMSANGVVGVKSERFGDTSTDQHHENAQHIFNTWLTWVRSTPIYNKFKKSVEELSGFKAFSKLEERFDKLKKLLKAKMKKEGKINMSEEKHEQEPPIKRSRN